MSWSGQHVAVVHSTLTGNCTSAQWTPSSRPAFPPATSRASPQSKRWAALGRILATTNRTRGYGDYYHYHRLAAGQLDAVIESDVNILDIAALYVIVTEAGGVFTDLEGQAPGLDTRSVLAATPALHAALSAELNQA